MSKWKVNKEKINTDIPDSNGVISGGAVTYPTKRLIVDAKKKVGSHSYSERTYIKENVDTGKTEVRALSDKAETKKETIQGLPIVNYRGIDMKNAIIQSVSANGTDKWSQSYGAVDDEFNVGLNVKGCFDTGYQPPYINFGINGFYQRTNSSLSYSKAVLYPVQNYVNYCYANLSNFKNNYVSYCCYPLYVSDTKNNIANTTGTDTSVFADQANRVYLRLDKVYDIMNINIVEECNYRLGAWHFHTQGNVYVNSITTAQTLSFYKLQVNSGKYSLVNISNPSTTSPYLHALFFEYRNLLTYKDGTTTYKQHIWKGDANANGIILVRRIKRNGSIPVKNGDGSYQWTLGLHALSETKFVLKTWNLLYDSSKTTDFDRCDAFFQNVILKGVVEYDTEMLASVTSGNPHYVDTRFYVEESDRSTADESLDIPEYEVYTDDILREQETRTYDVINREEWKKTVSESGTCVDDTTCKIFKEYTQQVMPSTTIIKASKCDVDEEESYTKDEKVKDLDPEKTNYSEWVKETLEKKDNEFNKAIFTVYFDKLDGTNIDKQTYTLTSKTDYDKYLAGTLGTRYVSTYPKVDGADAEYWYMASNKSVVEEGVELPDSYKYGASLTKVDLYKHSGIHFYPMMDQYDPITLKVTFYSPKTNTEILTKSKTISTLDEYKKFLNGTLTADYVSVPQTLNVDGYTDQPVGFWVLEDNWDKDIRKVKNESMTENDQYGDGDGLQRVNLSNHVMFGDKIELKFYPYIGVNNINHIVVSFQMNSNDLDNATAIYDADTNEKLIGPIGWLSCYAPSDDKGIYQYGYDDTTNSMLRGKGGAVIANIFFAHSGDNEGTGYEGVYIYAHKINEELYDTNSINRLSPKSIEEIYPNVKRFKIKMYGEWHMAGNTTLGTNASIKINAYQGGTPYTNNQQYLMNSLKLKDGSTETVKEYNYGGDSMAIWSRSGNWDPNNVTKGFIYDEFETIYDFMGYILYDTTLQAGEYIEPIIVGKRSGKYAYDETWENYPFYADPDDYEISLTEKVGFIKASRLDNTVIYVKKKN